MEFKQIFVNKQILITDIFDEDSIGLMSRVFANGPGDQSSFPG